jgi:hypothetical protein
VLTVVGVNLVVLQTHGDATGPSLSPSSR